LTIIIVWFMENENENLTVLQNLPIDEQPVIIELKSNKYTHYVGRYIKEENLFTLSLNENSDFVFAYQVYNWWYVNEHPLLLNNH